MVSLKEWSRLWSSGEEYWHCQEVNSYLKRNYFKFMELQPSSQVLVPLCGKSVDMKWLYERGHTVVGIEAVEQPILEFFDQYSLNYTKTFCDAVDGHLYESSDGRIKLFHCDVFNFCSNAAGLMDCVWDRGSLIAVNPTARQKYADLMITLMKNDFRYLLWTMEFDNSGYSHSPYPVPLNELQRLFKPWSIEILDHFIDEGNASESFYYCLQNNQSASLRD